MRHLGSITDIHGGTIEAVDCITGGSPYKVYAYKFPDGKVYVGMTKNTLEKRRDMGYQHNKPLQNAIRKYGWHGFEHWIIKDRLTRIRIAHLSQKKKVQSIDVYGNKKIYSSLHDAAEKVGGHPTNISRACRNNKGYKGLRWQFAE